MFCFCVNDLYGHIISFALQSAENFNLELKIEMNHFVDDIMQSITFSFINFII